MVSNRIAKKRGKSVRNAHFKAKKLATFVSKQSRGSYASVSLFYVSYVYVYQGSMMRVRISIHIATYLILGLLKKVSIRINLTQI